MLRDYDAVATIAAKDIQKTARFYQDVLGFKTVSRAMGTQQLQSGSTKILIYPSQFAGTNKATAITWTVDDVEQIVGDLKAKGATFEHYDNLPQVTRRGDIHIAGDLKNAWLKDPDGNILSIVGK